MKWFKTVNWLFLCNLQKANNFTFNGLGDMINLKKDLLGGESGHAFRGEIGQIRYLFGCIDFEGGGVNVA